MKGVLIMQLMASYVSPHMLPQAAWAGGGCKMHLKQAHRVRQSFDRMKFVEAWLVLTIFKGSCLP